MKYHCDQRVDLHGMRGDEAERRVRELIALSASRGRTILIIHGVGHGILRERIRRMVRNMPEVRDVRFGEDCLLPGLGGVTEILIRE